LRNYSLGLLETHIPNLTPKFSLTPRLANRFKLGADPEFYFSEAHTQQPIAANALNFRTGEAFGADLNGRLAEVRPQPSCSALAVVASLKSTLRWIPIQTPETSNLTWSTGAFAHRDGMGGHIHFGRKRQSRPVEIQALDFLANWGNKYFFSAASVRARQTHTNYGRLSDVRQQAYGYEYRTFPSWLASPYLAFFMLTAAKLVVLSPQLFLDSMRYVPATYDTNPLATNFIRFLTYFQALDDDACLLKALILARGYPLASQDAEFDFRRAWGITALPPIAPVALIPPNIAPSPAELEALFNELLFSRPIHLPLVPTWTRTNVPRGFTLLTQPTTGILGLGEIQAGIVRAINTPEINLHSTGSAADFIIQTPPSYQCPLAPWNKRLQPLARGLNLTFLTNSGAPRIRVHLGPNWRNNPRVTRKVLLSGLLPLWDAFTFDPNQVNIPTDFKLGQWAKGAN
jgi:hypothetical protein